jgi:non-haem Fe2+, alpha-ketoglutarate-dependent halogenase
MAFSKGCDQTILDAARFGKPLEVELQAGEFPLHSDLLLHGSEANTSTQRRCGLTLRYCAADVRAPLGWNGKEMVVSGVDAAGQRANPPRPLTD